MTIVVFLLVLTILVLIHELGHFFVAKKFNIKVEEFGIGFPPRAWGKKIGETIYSINWLPIGGFVKLYGEDEAGGGKFKIKNKILNLKDKNRAFYARPWWQRFLVGVAGVFMNFVLAWAIFSLLFAVVGTGVPKDEVLISRVVKGSPAEMVGLREGDIIQRINNKKIARTDELVSETRKFAGEEIILLVKRGSEVEFVEVIPRKDSPKGEGPLGVVIAQGLEVKKYPWYEAITAGAKQTFEVSKQIISGIGLVVSQLFTTGEVPKDVAGPVGIAQLTGFFCANPGTCLTFIALLSVNLAILNVLPLPALDGGRLFFILIEAVTRKRVNQRFESLTHAIGMALLLSLLALVTLYDLSRIFTGQPLIPR